MLGIDLEETDLDKTNQTDLDDTNGDETHLDKTDLDKTNVDETDLDKTDLDETNLGALMRGSRGLGATVAIPITGTTPGQTTTVIWIILTSAFVKITICDARQLRSMLACGTRVLLRVVHCNAYFAPALLTSLPDRSG